MTDLKKAHSVALQNQINPHFLLNTLQLVNLDIMRETRGDGVATRVVSLLSDILRNNLKTADYFVPLSHEIEQAKKYIMIENIRNNDKYSVEWEVGDGLGECKTVRFILQPVLENSIIHGLANSASKEKKITVGVRRDEIHAFITVTDNGLGMSNEALAEIRGKLEKSPLQESYRIGLCNVDMRIKLLFGEDCGISVESAPGAGTTVVIKQLLIADGGIKTEGM